MYFSARTRNNVLILMEISINKKSELIQMNYRSESFVREPEIEEFVGFLLTKDLFEENLLYCGR